jgi:hypothetical protein
MPTCEQNRIVRCKCVEENTCGATALLLTLTLHGYYTVNNSLVLKTGGSASWFGLCEACCAIQHGDYKAAIVARSNLVMGPTATATMAQGGVLSPDGSYKILTSVPVCREDSRAEKFRWYFDFTALQHSARNIMS